jgi:23S rRNA (guanosine2251-2'-O)-methyltransferase
MAKQEQFIFGIHAIREALDAGKELDRVLVRRGAGSDLLKQLLVELRKREIPVQQVPVEKLNRITRKNHQGVIAWISQVTYSRLGDLLPGIYEAGEEPLLLILDGVSDVRNFGAIARTAECAGVHAIVVPSTGSAAINADAVKTSAGALHRIPVCRERDLVAAVKFMRDSGLRILAASEKASDGLYAADLMGPVALIMGSEERGVSNALLRHADSWLAIPMQGKISSLNVSVAAGIVIYEVVRQRATPGEAAG